ncbi:C-type lectin domain family 4 member M-like [Scomber scombrus]|uniref:C-type lectin domain family 4 member M-like n=1 Tax=Scomber scombrus TaxID=13677 RepID=UPI002DDA998B|nr:C-type lectin domain family 4 member M-like [Scomber scombrus]
MENLQRRINFNRDFLRHYDIFGQSGSPFPNYRLLILCLGLLNVVLLITAVAIEIKCARVKEASLPVSHSAATQLINELNFLRSNHSDVIEAEEEAKKALEAALKNHTQLKVQIEQQKTINDDFQRQMDALRTEKTNLQTNISALEGTCGKCLTGWALFNSSCYFFSYSESKTVKKNWPDSREDCISRRADLVVIDNPEEQKFVSGSIDSMRSGRDIWQNGFWIGLTDTEAEGTWVWINNVTEVERRYWMDGEPNNLHQGEDCGVAVYSDLNPWKTWYDGRCIVKQLHWICEMALT